MLMTYLPECGWPETSLKLKEKLNSGQRHLLPRPGHHDDLGDGGADVEEGLQPIIIMIMDAPLKVELLQDFCIIYCIGEKTMATSLLSSGDDDFNMRTLGYHIINCFCYATGHYNAPDALFQTI